MVTSSRRRPAILLIAILLAVFGAVCPGSAQEVYVAFAQAGGPDADGVWGVASHADRTVAEGRARRACEARSALCGSEGLCALKPGLFAAFASDGAIPGNRGIACNAPTAAQAAAEARVRCGRTCSVLWTGSAHAAGADGPAAPERDARAGHARPGLPVNEGVGGPAECRPAASSESRAARRGTKAYCAARRRKRL